MPTVKDLIHRFFPTGTNPHRGLPDWNTFPNWPPDAFAISAHLVEYSGCYSQPRYAGGIDDSFHAPEAVEFAWRTSPRWSKLLPADQIPELQEIWEALYSDNNGEVTDCDHTYAQTWWDAAFKLLIAADQASEGVGFAATSSGDVLIDFVLRQYELLEDSNKPDRTLKNIPHSICLMVPKNEACVQPKARTAQLGCTPRSLSHHLALLPPVGDVTTNWQFGFNASEPNTKPLNLLLVPFPYKIDGACFRRGCQAQKQVIERLAEYHWGQAGKPRDRDLEFWLKAEQSIDNRAHFFHVEQSWLEGNGHILSPSEISVFLENLIKQSRREGHEINGIIMPELALEEKLAVKVGELLQDQAGLELFICGVASPSDKPGGLAKNQVYTCVFRDKEVLVSWLQAKHHRWKLEQSQLRRYQLTHRLDPGLTWWEGIDLERRNCKFFVFRRGACICSLICEDLARIDPVQKVIRAVGPNLVIALLMDGPQLLRRWPARYATVLADDPGCSVLTFTSLGLIQLSCGGEREAREIALWKDSGGETKELWLAGGSHALLVTLSIKNETNFTIDGRSDHDCTVRVSLDAVRSIKHPDPVPGWILQ